jgi:hypothetical protein
VNRDYRSSVTNADHPKIVKLCRLLGEGAYRCLHRLWGFAATDRQGGLLTAMDADDIEIAAGWPSDRRGEFVDALKRVHLLDETIGGSLSIHDWRDWNEYASHDPDRAARARANAHKKHCLGPSKCDKDYCEHFMPPEPAAQQVASQPHSKSLASRTASAEQNRARPSAPVPSPVPSPALEALAPPSSAESPPKKKSAKQLVETFVITDELRAYGRSLKLDADAFYHEWLDYYRSNGYRVGKNPLADPTATFQRWLRRAAEDLQQLRISGNRAGARTSTPPRETAKTSLPESYELAQELLRQEHERKAAERPAKGEKP